MFGIYLIMLVVIGSADPFLSSNVSRLIDEVEIRKIRTVKIDRLIKELKQPKRVAILDMGWQELQKPGVLRQLVNIAKISGNKVACISPNDDEKLKKLAKSVRPDEAFIRYDLEIAFREFLQRLAEEELEKKN